jgi:hypothetical protein
MKRIYRVAILSMSDEEPILSFGEPANIKRKP